MAVDPSRLQVQLLNTQLQSKDQPLYQLLNQMISLLAQLAKSSSSDSSGGGGSTTIINNAIQNILASVSDGIDGEMGPPGPPGLNGTNGTSGNSIVIPGNDGADGEDFIMMIQSPIKDTYAAPLCNGDATYPELIFDSFGDVIMVTGLTTP